MKDSCKKYFNILLRISISLALLIFLFRHVDRKGVFALIKGADLEFLFLAFIIFLSSYILSFYRWKMLLKGLNVRLSSWRVLTGFCAGTFFNLFLPSTIGGDLFRGIDLSRHTNKPKEVTASLLLDRLSGYVGLVLVSSVAMLCGYRLIQDRATVIIIILISALLIFILLILFNNFLYTKVNQIFSFRGGNKISLILKDLHREIYYFRNHKRIILYNLFISLLIQLCAPIVFYLTARALGIETRIIYFFVFVPVISTVTLLPISIGGLGLRDATTIFFFIKVGFSKDFGLSISLISFIFLVIVGCIGGIVYVFTLHSRRV